MEHYQVKTSAIVILDIGKTNKKVLVFDRHLRLLEKDSKNFGEVTGRAGLKLEQPQAVFDWFLNRLKFFSGRYSISAISVTTHGAMGVCVDSNGDITCPPIAYTNKPGRQFCDAFFNELGDRLDLQSQTATAEIGEMINFAKILYYLKKNFPDEMEKTRHILLYPQYFGFRITGNVAAEHTMLGCHTYLYDHKKNTYSDVARKLGLVEKLPEKICFSWDRLGVVNPQIARQCGLANDCIVTVGVHDSNASLLPFLLTENDNFVLNSTGTWCVAMKPAKSISFKPQELGRNVFYNQDVFGRPVKTSIFMGGLEYETYTKLFTAIHKRSDLPAFDYELYHLLFDRCNAFILPSVVQGAGLFPLSRPTLVDGGSRISLEQFRSKQKKPSFAENYDLSIAALISSLAVQTSCALDAAGYQDGGQIFVEGGFRQNQPYLKLLTAFYPQSKVYKTNINEATALGAAILALAALQSRQPHKLDIDIEIEKQLVDRVQGLDVGNYKKHFSGFIQNINERD